MSPALILAAIVAPHIVDFSFRDVDLQPPPGDVHGWSEWNGFAVLGGGLLAPASIEVTPKGNGTLSLLNLELRVIDEHLDIDTYRPYFLRTFVVDLDADGFKDLVVCGQVGMTDDDCDCIVRWEPVVEVFRLDPRALRFVPVLPERLARIDCLGY